MNSEFTPFVREQLQATRNNECEPNVLVDVWLDRFLALTAGEVVETPETRAYDSLAHWARLRRVRPELIQELGLEADWQAADQLVASSGADLVSLAAGVPTPSAWIEEAEEFSRAFETGLPPSDHAQWGARLLEDLDDAVLFCWAANQFGLPQSQLTGELFACEKWILQHAYEFNVCSMDVQAIGLTIQPDLVETSFELAMTADHYILVLDALEEVEEDFSFPSLGVPKTLASTIKELAATHNVRPTAHNWPSLLSTSETLLAAASEESGKPELLCLCWHSPDGKYSATLYLSALQQSAARLVVDSLAGDHPTADLEGTSIWLAGVHGELNHDAVDLPLHALRLAAREKKELTFAVGEPEKIWSPQP